MKYCKTKKGDIFKIWSDNTEEETMHVYPADENFDAESTITNVIAYSDIECVDSNLSILENK